jgi:uncharacterized SAM-binding protein YcdF (DUF218 family)
MKTRLLKLLLLLSLFLITLYLSTPSLLRLSGRYLQLNVPLSNPDLIIVLSGDSDGSRTQHAVDIFNKTPTVYLLLTGGMYYDLSVPKLMKKRAVSLGIPEHKILLEEKSTSTYENALFAKQLIVENKFKSVLVVTSRFHTKRSFCVFSNVLEELPIKLGISGAYDGIDYSSWWTNNRSSEIVLMELAKVLWYKLAIL